MILLGILYLGYKQMYVELAFLIIIGLDCYLIGYNDGIIHCIMNRGKK